MVKGCQRKIIHVKDPSSKYYDEAYFILKTGVGDDTAEGDMINEAVKIAGESLACVTNRKKHRRLLPSVYPFFAGIIAGGILWGGIYLLIC